MENVDFEGAELLDVLDESGASTGAVKSRAEVHRDGDWHRAFHLWVVREGRYVLLQRRSDRKDLEPGRIDVTVGGHYRAGETLGQVVREAEEEIGLAVAPHQLSRLGTWRSDRVHPGGADREFQEVYALADDRPLEDYHLHCSEVAVLYEVPLERALALYRDGGYVPAPGMDCQRRTNNALLVEDDLIEQGRAATAEALEALRGWLADAEPG